MPRNSTDQPDALDMRRALTSWILERVTGVRVGIVQSYDQAQRLAVVQPVRRRRIFGTPQPLPAERVPVGWWRFGTMVLAGEVQPGDEVLLVGCEREIWPWYTTGAQHDPSSERLFHPSDSVALPWISNVKRAITARLPGTFYMGREDASAGVTVTQGPAPGRTTVEGTGPASVVLGSAAADTLVKYPAHAAAFNTYLGAIATAYTAWVASTGGPPPNPAAATPAGNGAFILALGGAAATLLTAINAAATMGTVKTVAE